MQTFRSISRYLLMAAAVFFLAVGLSNCSNSAPPVASAPSAETSSASTAGSDPKININTAILSDLDRLEAKLGIPALSNQIQASRPYGSSDDLVSKGVLKPAQYDQIKDQVTVEEIVLTGEAKDVDYLAKLALMKGHMLIAGELLRLNQPEKAEPHLGHPVEEIYVDIQDQLPERKVSEFSTVLTSVQDLVKSKPKDPKVMTEYKTAMQSIDKAVEALPTSQQQSPAFVLKSMTEVLETAVAEYTAAISDGKFTAEIEYQDSRGFVDYARTTLFKKIEPTLAQSHPGLEKELKTKLDNLFKAWPQPIPPAAPVMTPQQVASQVKAIEQAIAPVIQAS